MSNVFRYQPGQKIGERYEVCKVKAGGMGEVYLCFDTESRTPYALKTFQPQYLSHQKLRELFQAEVLTWVALGKHPNIVRCFGVDVYDNVPFMILEWVMSAETFEVDLRGWLEEYGPLEISLAINFVIGVCQGLIHAQQVQPGIVHRDLKPENILIGQGKIAKITDFGYTPWECKTIRDRGART